jgi:hypothetical protein
MQSSQKMRYEAFIPNDEVTCLHVAIQGTQKVIVIGRHDFKDEALIKRQRVAQKMNGMGEKLKDKNKWSNHHELFSFTIRSPVFYQSFGVCKNMSVKSVINKLEKVAREKEA